MVLLPAVPHLAGAQVGSGRRGGEGSNRNDNLIIHVCNYIIILLFYDFSIQGNSGHVCKTSARPNEDSVHICLPHYGVPSQERAGGRGHLDTPLLLELLVCCSTLCT